MAWTSADVTRVEDAIRAVLDGKTVSFAGKTVSFENLDQLRSLRLDMLDEVNSAAGDAGFWSVATVRGN